MPDTAAQPAIIDSRRHDTENCPGGADCPFSCPEKFASPKIAALAAKIEAKPEWSVERLLQVAVTMLDEARKEQAASSRKNKWLTDNVSLEVIRLRAARTTAA